MADEQSTNPTPEVEAQDTGSDDFDDLFDDDAEDTTETTDSTDDTAATESDEEAEEQSEQSDEESDDTTDDSESEEQSEDSETDSQEEDTASDEPQTEEERKRFNEEMYKRRQAEKQLREERKAREQETLDRYLKEAEDDELEYQKRVIEVNAFQVQQERSQVIQDRLETDLLRAVNDIDLFKSAPTEIKEELAAAVDEFEDNHVVKDEKGNLVRVNGNVYEFLQKKADSIRRIQGVGERQASKDKSETKSRTVTPPSKSPKQPKSDDAIDGFNEEADRW